jgi:hypothetical protein
LSSHDSGSSELENLAPSSWISRDSNLAFSPNPRRSRAPGQLALASRNISAARDSRRILCEMRESEVLDISSEEEEVAVLQPHGAYSGAQLRGKLNEAKAGYSTNEAKIKHVTALAKLLRL